MSGQAAKGPLNALLSSSGAQWAALVGIGTYITSPDKVMDLAASVLERRASSSSSSSMDRMSPIIIQTGSDSRGGGSNSGGGGILTTVVTYTIGAGCVWVSYTVLSNVLPEFIGDLLPVTRKVFDKASKNLASSIVNVKEVLGNQILNLMKKQDDLGKKQDDTHRDVKDIQDDMKFVRGDLSSVVESVDRCEASIESSQQLNSYTARGVKLLVAAVSTVLPRDDHQIIRELQDYARDGEVFRRQLESSRPPQPQTPPENEHPRQQQQHPQLVEQTSQLQTNSAVDFNAFVNNSDLMAMLRDGRLVMKG
jgi:hypothetical protein